MTDQERTPDEASKVARKEDMAGEDVAGHGLRRKEEPFADDVEGHGLRRKEEPTDDVEGHLKRRREDAIGEEAEGGPQY
jgi:hypothetical protein